MLRPEALEALAGVEQILHAGDIGAPEVLAALQSIAPVTAIKGNNDKGHWTNDLPDVKVVKVGAVRIYMLHNIKEIAVDPEAEGFHVVVSGHSHTPLVNERHGVLYINPGSAGPRRFSLPISVARLTVSGAAISAELIELKPR